MGGDRRICFRGSPARCDASLTFRNKLPSELNVEKKPISLFSLCKRDVWETHVEREQYSLLIKPRDESVALKIDCINSVIFDYLHTFGLHQQLDFYFSDFH